MTTFGGRNTPLHYAAYQGHLGVVNLLINSGAKVNARNQAGITAVFFASQMGHDEVVEYLVQNGADLSIADTDYSFTAFGTYTVWWFFRASLAQYLLNSTRLL